MDEAVLSPFLQVLFHTIADLLKKELLQLGHDLEDKRKSLASYVPLVQAVLNGTGKKPLSEQQKLWFADLKDVGYKAIEVLDECYYEARRREVITALARLRNNTSISSMNLWRRKFRKHTASDIEDIERGMIDLERKRLTLQIEVHSRASELCEESTQHQSSSFPPIFVHGRQDDQDKIVKMLLQSDLKRNVDVLPILGEAYIGKTTVAQLVINDEHVSRYFERRMWVHVSQEFNIERITASIIESLGRSPFHSNNLNTLQTHLEKQLRGRRYLLVLDDYRRESWHDWEKLKHPLLNGAVGSKIIVTTRSRAVARDLGTSESYQLRSLPQEDCWLLFCQHALGTDIQAYNSGVSRLKEDVLQKCKGVPFIAASLGHRLHQENDRSKWASILREENWDSSSSDFDRALRLSYAELDSHLKPCFAYSSIVPQKFQFEEEWLVQHWMAQGFIQPKPNTMEMMEDTGRAYFRSLVGQSFFQRAHLDPTGEQHSYNFSQMMHDLALHVSAEECYIMEGPCDLPEKVRHLTVVVNATNMFETIPNSSRKCLHTLIVVGGSVDYSVRIPKDLGKRFTSLRTLDLSNFGVCELPESIGKLKHLRCLQLRSTKIRRLTESICDLYNLQTLGLRDCYDLEQLPLEMKNLRKLRHIDLVMARNPCHGVCSLRCMPKDIGLLTDLQTLSRFVVSKRNTHKGGIGELANLKNLRGELLISNLHLVKDAQEAAQAHLASKQFLQKLELSWSNSNKQSEQILEHLKPPTTIKEITISGYPGMACPSWLGYADYTHLITVRLYDFKTCSDLPPLGLLPVLENLYLKGWDGLITMNCSAYGGSSAVNFQSLKKLHLERMDSLQRWESRDGDERCAFPSLRVLLVKNCPQLRTLPRFIENLRALEDMEIVGCGQLTYLPQMNGLISLQRLEISDCGSIRSRPNTGLPRSLQFLSINNCRWLSWSSMNVGSDIFSVWIDGKPIR